MEKAKIEDILIDNAKINSEKYKSEIMSWNGLVLAKKEFFVPAYIPYIGKNYLISDVKIMIYALSQNLHPDWDTTINYANAWNNNQDVRNTLNRQNISFNNNERIQIHPFDSGHLPILAGILINLVSKRVNINPITDVSATNLSKFSFRDINNRTTDNELSLNNCFDWFSKKELEVLQPKYIICAGEKVFKIVKKKVAHNKFNATPIKVSFPSIQVINSLYKGKKLTANNEKTYEDNIATIFSEDFLNKKTDYKNEKKIKEILYRDAYYFVKMYESIKNKLEND